MSSDKQWEEAAVDLILIFKRIDRTCCRSSDLLEAQGRLKNFPLVSSSKHKPRPPIPTSSIDRGTLETDSSQLSEGD